MRRYLINNKGSITAFRATFECPKVFGASIINVEKKTKRQLIVDALRGGTVLKLEELTAMISVMTGQAIKVTDLSWLRILKIKQTSAIL